VPEIQDKTIQQQNDSTDFNSFINNSMLNDISGLAVP
jgi:hypothetical protein